MLTDAQCRNAQCPADKKRARFTDAGGLYLEVSPAGSKRWFWKIYLDGKETRLALGSYPDVSLTAARKAREAAKLQKSDGHNPVLIRKIDKLRAKTADADTFKVTALEWYPNWGGGLRRPGRGLDFKNPKVPNYRKPRGLLTCQAACRHQICAVPKRR